MSTTGNGARNKLYIFVVAVFALSLNGCRKNSAEKSVPTRIVCLSPSGAEILSALGEGGRIVARTDFCNYPAEILSLPSVGGFDGKSVSVEKILSFSPDLVYGSEGIHDGIFRQIENFGTKTYAGKGSRGISETETEIKEIAEILGAPEKGEEIVGQMEEKIQSVPKSVPFPKVYYEVWCEPFITAGKNSFIGEIIQKAGGENVFGETSGGYPMISEESIIAKMPDVIILPDSNGITTESVKNRHGWVQIPAVKNARIFLVDADLLSRPGPRIADAVLLLNGIFQDMAK